MMPEQLTVLLIEDNAGDALLIRKMLAGVGNMGFHLETAHRLSEGLERLAQSAFDVVLLDLTLPDSQGIESFHRLHAHVPDIPIAILSGLDDESLAIEAVHAGAQDYLIKGQVSGQLLARAVRYAVERAKSLAREQAARAHAEDAQRRFAFLAEVSSQLASSLDFETTLELIAHLAVPEFADCCVVHTINEDQGVHLPIVVHVDSSHQELIHELFRRYPITLDDPKSVLARVLRTREPVLIEEISDAVLESFVKDAGYREILRAVRPVSGIAVPLTARGRTLGALAFTNSVSGRRYGPCDLILAEDVARRAALAIDNARLYKDLQQADQFKNEFLAMLAHELRNPLAPIVTALQILRMRRTADEPVQRAQEVLERQVRQMSRLVDDLLDVSRITHGKIDLQKTTVDLRNVVSNAVQTSRPLIDARGHRLFQSLPPEPVWLEADPTRLEQVVLNLLNNAAKYTEPGGKIWLEVERDREEAVIRVRDTGIGIPQEMLRHIFGLFTQVTSSGHHTREGLGLGLTLVRSLVDMHGGTIAVQSDGPGNGSEFEVRLPAPGAAGADLGPTEVGAKNHEEMPSGPSLRILIVDDNRDAAETLVDLLQIWGHQVDAVHDGPAALEVAARSCPEVVLLDIGLPGMDGYQVAARLREHPSTASARLLALTGYGQEEDVRRSREAGFDHHLTKPVDLDALQDLLRSCKS